MLEKSYIRFLDDLKIQIKQSRIKAHLAVNRELILLYYKKLKGKKEKAIVIGLVNRDTQQVKAMKVTNSEAKHLLPKIYMNVADSSTIITDTLQAYKPLKKHYNHKTFKHSAGEYVKNDSRVTFKIHINTIEGFWGELKRSIRGIYHRASHKHIQKYCNEFSYRYNNRNLKNNERFVDFLSGLANIKLTYKTLTA